MTLQQVPLFKLIKHLQTLNPGLLTLTVELLGVDPIHAKGLNVHESLVGSTRDQINHTLLLSLS